jgi:hypothetical protein
MPQRNRRLSRALIAGALMSALAIPHAAAHNESPKQDRSDNVITFEYEKAGEIVSQASSRRWSRGDEIDFEVIVKEARDSGPGLKGTLRLRLVGDHAKTYDGWFALKVTAEDGEVAYHRTRPATISLGPEPGRRVAWMNYRFDLPGGSYEATATFERDS